MDIAVSLLKAAVSSPAPGGVAQVPAFTWRAEPAPSTTRPQDMSSSRGLRSRPYCQSLQRNVDGNARPSRLPSGLSKKQEVRGTDEMDSMEQSPGAGTPLPPSAACKSHYNPGLAVLSSEPMLELPSTIGLFLLRHARLPAIDRTDSRPSVSAGRGSSSDRAPWRLDAGHSGHRRANRGPDFPRTGRDPASDDRR